MLVKKEIRVVALLLNIPGYIQDPQEYLRQIAEHGEPIVFCYDRSCPMDASCIKACISMVKIGVVAWEDKKYLIPLLEMSLTKMCKGDFIELYWDENMTPILRYSVSVDLFMVKKDEPGELWKDWKSNSLVTMYVEEWDNTEYLITMISANLTNKNDYNPADVAEMVASLSKMSRYDISIETTTGIEDICFMLEMEHCAESDVLKNKLQRLSTSRRSKRTIMRFTEKWWPDLCKSKMAVGMLHTYLMRLKAKYKLMDNDNCKEHFSEEYNILERDLQSLPYNLYDHVDDPPLFFYYAFYTKITREKMKQLYTVMVMRFWMRSLLASKVNTFGALLIPGAIDVENMFAVGDVNITHGDAHIGTYYDNSKKTII